MTDHPADGPEPALDSDAQRSQRWAGVNTQEGFDELRNAASAPGAPLGAPSTVWQTFFDALGGNGRWRPTNWRHGRRVCSVACTRTAPPTTCMRRKVMPAANGRCSCCRSSSMPTNGQPIERGVIQRARLLDATLADVYGPQTLLRDALLPPSLVFAHPQYLRPAHGIVPPGGVHLHVVAFDLARGPEGRWWVLAQRRRRRRAWAMRWRTGSSSRACSPRPSRTCTCSAWPSAFQSFAHCAACARAGRRTRAHRAAHAGPDATRPTSSRCFSRATSASRWSRAAT